MVFIKALRRDPAAMEEIHGLEDGLFMDNAKNIKNSCHRGDRRTIGQGTRGGLEYPRQQRVVEPAAREATLRKSFPDQDWLQAKAVWGPKYQ